MTASMMEVRLEHDFHNKHYQLQHQLQRIGGVLVNLRRGPKPTQQIYTLADSKRADENSLLCKDMTQQSLKSNIYFHKICRKIKEYLPKGFLFEVRNGKIEHLGFDHRHVKVMFYMAVGSKRKYPNRMIDINFFEDCLIIRGTTRKLYRPKEKIYIYADPTNFNIKKIVKDIKFWINKKTWRIYD
jgi:hypothetical protein